MIQLKIKGSTRYRLCNICNHHGIHNPNEILWKVLFFIVR